jgi:hypothetical protein
MEDAVRDQIAQLMTRRCCNCLSKLPGYNVKAWRWLNPNIGPFCEDCWKEVKKGERHED